MTEEIKPALSAEEWRELRRGGGMSIEGEHLVLTVDSGQYYNVRDAYGPPDRHALAALALHGQPFGFSRDDAEILRAWSKLWDYPIRDSELERRFGGVADKLRDLADRIAALLPPAKVTP